MYDPQEQKVVLEVFTALLAEVTRDGGQKRARGEKPPWWCDVSHEAAVFSHLAKWKKGLTSDPDSGTHPLVHAAWRCLAIAYQELRGKRDPSRGRAKPPYLKPGVGHVCWSTATWDDPCAEICDMCGRWRDV